MSLMSSRTSRFIGIAGLTTAGLLLFSACSSTPDLEEVWQDAQTNAEEATSVTIEADGTLWSEDEPLNARFSGEKDDSFFEASITTGDITLKMVSVDGRTVAQGNSAFFADMEAESLSELVGDKWFDLPGESPYTFSSFYDQVVAGFTDTSPDELSNVESEDTELDGQPVYMYSGQGEEGQQASYYFSQDHELLRIVGQDEAENLDFDIRFTDWNNVTPAELPAEEEIVSFPGA